MIDWIDTGIKGSNVTRDSVYLYNKCFLEGRGALQWILGVGVKTTSGIAYNNKNYVKE